MAIRGYVFDYGGTLDTDGCHWGKMIWHAYGRCGAGVEWQQFKQAYIYAERYMSAHGVISGQHTFRQTLQTKLDLQTRFLCDQKMCKCDERQRNELCRMMLDDLYQRVTLTTAQNRQVLSRLRQNAALALVSNFYGNLQVVLEEFRLDGLFSTVIESAVVGIRKPDPQLFRLAIDGLGLQPAEVVVVGDSIRKDILPAKSLGCHTVWLKGEGWDDHPDDGMQAERVITSIRQLENE